MPCNEDTIDSETRHNPGTAQGPAQKMAVLTSGAQIASSPGPNRANTGAPLQQPNAWDHCHCRQRTDSAHTAPSARKGQTIAQIDRFVGLDLLGDRADDLRVHLTGTHPDHLITGVL